MLKYEYGRTRHSIADNSPSSVTFTHVADSRVARAVAGNQRLNIMPVNATHAETRL